MKTSVGRTVGWNAERSYERMPLDRGSVATLVIIEPCLAHPEPEWRPITVIGPTDVAAQDLSEPRRPPDRWPMRCWCGNDALSPFCEGYTRCDRCQTLVSRELWRTADTRVHDDSADFYGRDYWFNH